MANITSAMCAHKHTAYQPTDDEWKCPSCGAGVEFFHIDNFVDDDMSKCDDLLHDNDDVGCHKCQFGTNGKNFAGRLQRMHNLVKCECCRGTGLVVAKPEERVTVGSFDEAIKVAKKTRGVAKKK
jgi:hypothetical protein